MNETPLFKSSLAKAMALCSRREYCGYEIVNKLLSWGVGENDAGEIINVLTKEGFINELRYATAFARDKFSYNKWGMIKIEAHLKAKKVSPEIISSALSVIDNKTYVKLLNELITNRMRSVKAKNQYDLKAKLLRYGLSKGYESSLLYDILNEIDE